MNKKLTTKNTRVATRFIRKDISVSINISGLFKRGKTIAADLIDISSKGVLIATEQQFNINQEITLTLQFKSSKAFDISSTIVRKSGSPPNGYGIKFYNWNHELGDYLFETQEDLVFK